MKKYLILGSGGREHALVWQLAKYGNEVEAAPGNDAISQYVPTWTFNSSKELIQQIKERQISEVIIGPEKYLEAGLSNELQEAGIEVFGPTKEAARLETSKSWAKAFCNKYQIPTAQYGEVKTAQELTKKVASFNPPYVVKASGLASGKGVIVTEDFSEAETFGKQMLEKHSSVIIEEFLAGEEISCFYAVEGTTYSYLGEAQDHKRLLENDKGPNTGGMGAYSPVPFFSYELKDQIEREVLIPTLEGLAQESLYYRGFIFLGLMLVKGKPYVLEYNCRLGDPEAQNILSRLKRSLPEIIHQPSKEIDLDSQQSSLSVVVASKGYPEKPQKDFRLEGVETPPPGTEVFHSGTYLKDGQWYAKGGRLFCITCKRATLRNCQEVIYPWIEGLGFTEHIHYRKDIGAKAFKYLKGESSYGRTKTL